RGRAPAERHAEHSRGCRIAIFAAIRGRPHRRGRGLPKCERGFGTGLRRARLFDLEPRILMQRLRSILIGVWLFVAAWPLHAQVPSTDQLELLRSMSPEDRAALMEQLGIGANGSQSRDDARSRDRSRDEREDRNGELRDPDDALTLDRARLPLDKSLKVEDSILITVDVKKDEPPRLEPQV